MTMRSNLPDRLSEELMPRAGERALCAVSGGLDSMCLLDLLERWCRDRGAELYAAHFNHGLRGAAADRDEAFVRSVCEARGIPLTVGREAVAARARVAGQSLEEAGRALRYDFLNRTAEALGCRGIYTAHHAEDSAETVLWNLIRGTGLKGLTGIPRRQGLLRRPLLETTRGELADYAAARGLTHIHDETNDDPAAASRNFLRLRVMPLLEELNPRAAEHMARTAAILAREDEALEVLAEMEGSSAMRDPTGRTGLLTGILESWPRAASERMVLQLMGKTAGHRRDFTARHVEAVLALGPGKSLSLPHGLLVRRTGECLWFERAAPLPAGDTVPEGTPVSFGRWTVRLAPEAGEGIAYKLSLPRDAETAVTCWRREDRMCLPGQRGSRSFKRLCAERGIPVWDRDRLPVLRAGDVPAAAPGIGVDRSFLPRAGERALFVTFQEKENEEDGHDEK